MTKTKRDLVTPSNKNRKIIIKKSSAHRIATWLYSTVAWLCVCRVYLNFSNSSHTHTQRPLFTYTLPSCLFIYPSSCHVAHTYTQSHRQLQKKRIQQLCPFYFRLIRVWYSLFPLPCSSSDCWIFLPRYLFLIFPLLLHTHTHLKLNSVTKITNATTDTKLTEISNERGWTGDNITGHKIHSRTDYVVFLCLCVCVCLSNIIHFFLFSIIIMCVLVN